MELKTMENEKFPLRIVFFELTARCNLSCVHCRAEASIEGEKDELRTDEVKRVLEEIRSLGNVVVILTGGEPLMRKDFFEIAEHARKIGLITAMASNGTLIDEGIAKKIKDSGIRRVSISIDGGTALTHDSFRGIKGSFEEALRGIENLKKAGISVQINTTITKYNVKERDLILDLTKNLGVAALHIFMLVPVGCGINIVDSAMLSPEEYEETLNWFYEKWVENPGIEFKATCAPHFYRIVHQRGKPEREDFKKAFSTFTRGCLAGTNVCFISRKGDVQPCGYLPVIAGNVREKSFVEIWKHSPVFLKLRDYDELQGKCGICEFKKICGGCRARAYYDRGSFLEEEPYCLYEPILLKKATVKK
jgi:heme b synthase